MLRQGLIPRHVAIIMDGNRRYSRRNSLRSAAEGHSRGYAAMLATLEWLYELGVQQVGEGRGQCTAFCAREACAATQRSVRACGLLAAALLLRGALTSTSGWRLSLPMLVGSDSRPARHASDPQMSSGERVRFQHRELPPQRGGG